MYSLNVDTNSLKESGRDIISLTTELNEEFQALFSRISNMSNRTFEWVGASADEFIRRTNIEKAQYAKLVNILKQYGKLLIDVADEYEIVSKQEVEYD